MKLSSLFFIVLTYMLLPFPAQANWQFTGNLIIPPSCQLGKTDPIRVSFGEVAVGKVDGTAYRKNIPFAITCDRNTNYPWDVKLTFGGTLAGTGFDNATLSTRTPKNTGKFGIQIQVNGKPQPLNRPFSIRISAPPVISAVPVKLSNAKLVADDFTASGTLTIDFQ